MINILKKIWVKLFGKKPLFKEIEIECLGKKTKIQEFDKKRLYEVLEFVESGTMLFTSPRTIVQVTHVDSLFPEEKDAD
jgi:hypothetical protein